MRNATRGIAEPIRLFLSVCGAISFAHQRLILHRDSKPSNILVTDEGVAKLLDFGIAKIVEVGAEGELTGTGMAMLTPAFASPEQISGRPVTMLIGLYSGQKFLCEPSEWPTSKTRKSKPKPAPQGSGANAPTQSAKSPGSTCSSPTTR